MSLPHGPCFLGTPVFCHRDLKVSNLLMTDKGCVKTGGCRVLGLRVWEVAFCGHTFGGGGVSPCKCPESPLPPPLPLLQRILAWPGPMVFQ